MFENMGGEVISNVGVVGVGIDFVFVMVMNGD